MTSINDSQVLTNFGQQVRLLFKLHIIWSVILKKIMKTVATKGQILWLKCTEIDFSWGSAPDPA